MDKKHNKSTGNKPGKLIISCLFLVAIFILAYQFKNSIGFDRIKLTGFKNTKNNERANPLKKSNVVITSVQMGLGDDTLGLVLASPYNNKKQQAQLSEYEIQIKNDFLMQVNEEKLKEWVKKRNFNDIKSTFLNIVNKYLDEPVKEVYLSSFFYE